MSAALELAGCRKEEKLRKTGHTDGGAINQAAKEGPFREPSSTLGGLTLEVNVG